MTQNRYHTCSDPLVNIFHSSDVYVFKRRRKTNTLGQRSQMRAIYSCAEYPIFERIDESTKAATILIKVKLEIKASSRHAQCFSEKTFSLVRRSYSFLLYTINISRGIWTPISVVSLQMSIDASEKSFEGNKTHIWPAKRDTAIN